MSSQDLFIQVGRVVFINFGPNAGKIAVVLDIINDTTVLVDGPTTGVERSVIPLKRVEVTKFYLPKIMRNQRSGALKKIIEEFKLNEKWAGSEKAKKHARQEKRAQLTDFERFKVVTLRRQVGKHLRKWVNEQRKTQAKTAAKK